MINQSDIEAVVESYRNKLNPKHRFTSFDYCYNYFHQTHDLNEDVEKSCLVLGFYLASWGMYRGSSFLLKHSAQYLLPTIKYLSLLDKDEPIWRIDVDAYTEENIKVVIEVYNQIKERLITNRESDLTLVTKVMLGVFGAIPAFDNYFCSTFRLLSNGQCGFRRLNGHSLRLIHDFYQANKVVIDSLSESTFTTDFATGKKTNIKYPKAKIIDMYGFYKNAMKTEKVFEILGEGGGIMISRKLDESEKRFIYHHNEFDPTDEGLDVNKVDEYPTFEDAFEVINRYPWHMLYINTVHNDYRDYIINKLINKLTTEEIQPEFYDYHKDKVEQILKIELTYKILNDGKPKWSARKK